MAINAKDVQIKWKHTLPAEKKPLLPGLKQSSSPVSSPNDDLVENRSIQNNRKVIDSTQEVWQYGRDQSGELLKKLYFKLNFLTRQSVNGQL